MASDAIKFELLRHLHVQPAKNIRVLAQALGRDDKNVYEDVLALESAGLLDKDDDGVRAEYDTLDLRLSVAL